MQAKGLLHKGSNPLVCRCGAGVFACNRALADDFGSVNLPESAIAEANPGGVDVVLVVDLLEIQTGVGWVAPEQLIRPPGLQFDPLR